jgi:hypothetical protein
VGLSNSKNVLKFKKLPDVTLLACMILKKVSSKCTMSSLMLDQMELLIQSSFRYIGPFPYGPMF